MSLKQKRNITYLTILGFAALMLLLPLLFAFGDLSERYRTKCYPTAGSWMLVWDFPPGVEPLVITETLTPQDAFGMKLVYWGTGVNPMYALAPWFPDSDFAGDAVGTFVRTGRNTYDFTMVTHLGKSMGLDARGEIQYFWVYSGTAECTDESTMVKNGTLAFFSAVQDSAPHDGFPDEGEEPFLCLPVQWTSKRVQLTPPYEPTPMP